jgi:hypothetical protein
MQQPAYPLLGEQLGNQHAERHGALGDWPVREDRRVEVPHETGAVA